MKRLLCILILTLYCPVIYAQDTCTVGVFVTDLYDFKLNEKSFSINFWLWMNYANDSLAMLENAEMINAKEHEFVLPTVEKRQTLNYAAEKCNAVIKKDWDVASFPFDKQALTVWIESGDQDASDLIFTADTLNSKLDERIKMTGWRVRSFQPKSSVRTYATTYGDPDARGNTSYAAFEFTTVIERDSFGLFFKLFTGVYIAFGISVMVFLMGPENAERFGLLVGALFASIGNKYIVDSILPDTNTYTLVDKIHSLTFLYILFCLGITVWVYQLHVREQTALAKRIDWYCFLGFVASYIILNLWMVVSAARAASV